jgi:hypothetical protein
LFVSKDDVFYRFEMQNDQEPKREPKELKLSIDKIYPWDQIAVKIKTMIDREHIQDDSDEEAKEEIEHTQINTAIPNGFQWLKNIALSKNSINSVVYMPTGPTLEIEKFGTFDTNWVHFWKNGTHQSKIAACRLKEKNTIATPFSGIERWIYINAWKLIILSTSSMEIRVLLD